MTTQPPLLQRSLWSVPVEPAPHSGSSTSRAAAAAVKPKAPSQRRAVLQFLKSHPSGLTDAELQNGLQLSGNSERPRRRELQKAGLVTDSGRRRDGQIIWIAVDAATQVIK